MAAACAAAGIEFITGTELTAEHHDTEVHILGYFVDARNQSCWRKSPSSRPSGRTASAKWWPDSTN